MTKGPRDLIGKSFLKSPILENDFKIFKENLDNFSLRINDNESEEFNKNVIRDFLNHTFYKDNYYINTKDRKDLVIHNGRTSKSSVGVIIEAKKPDNKSEMVSLDNLNTKAMHELIYYYLNERVISKNIELKFLIITNAYEWFIFDATLFEKVFYNNRHFREKFIAFKSGSLSGKTTDFFYQEIAKPFIKDLTEVLDFGYFDIRDYKKYLNIETKSKAPIQLRALYKLLSPEGLLKVPFENDNNTLNKSFYSELLYIMGLNEKKENSTKVIKRFGNSERQTASLLENTIEQLKALDKVHTIQNPARFGLKEEERLFSISMELVITWINRVLFLKLLEGQLISYNQNNKDFAFLTTKHINNFDDLNTLFFSVLAKKESERTENVNKFDHIPYLNSSLFEQSSIENEMFFISQLNEYKLPLFKNTILKNSNGKKLSGDISIMDYLLRFLDAYDFGSESTSQSIKKEKKTIINASVLGLIFEKINGYADGSFFTPGYITMYMSKKVIRKKVISKFNKIYNWKAKNLNDIYNLIDDKKAANEIINSIKICDPAVGSGHFLVSALNELIAIKSDLGILVDSNGRTLRDYTIIVENDELLILNENGEQFVYNRQNKESQRVQETIFNEKRSIIEGCLFGVDINPNSANICKLRLWIELLKHAYYIDGTNFLETLPNIDINIRVGNSLISRYALDSSIGSFTKKSKYTVQNYLDAVNNYRHTSDKKKKRELVGLIDDIRSNFESNLNTWDNRILKLSEHKSQLNFLENQMELFEDNKVKKEKNKEKVVLKKKITDLETELSAVKNNKVYENSFEWRFEFPEVLDSNGKFMGFDIIIGNPPYIYRNLNLKLERPYFVQNYQCTEGNFDLYKFFVERANELTIKDGYTCMITNSSFLMQQSFSKTRNYLLQNARLLKLIPLGAGVFEEATVDTAIYISKKSNNKITHANKVNITIPYNNRNLDHARNYSIQLNRFLNNDKYTFDCFLNNEEYALFEKLQTQNGKMWDHFDIGVGINTGYIRAELTSDEPLDERYHPMVPGSGIIRYGSVNTTGYIMYDADFVRSKGELGRTLPEESYFKLPKILVVRTRNVSLRRRIVATIDNEQKYNLNRLSNIVSKGSYSLFSLLGILNSDLYNWLYTKKYFDYEVKPNYLKESPIPLKDDDRLDSLVKQRLNATTEEDFEKLEGEINNRVFELFGVNDLERAMIKDGEHKTFG